MAFLCRDAKGMFDNSDNMPSRKKAQGQARRNAKAAKAKDNETEEVREENSLPLQNLQMQKLVIGSLALVTAHDDSRCKHGFDQFPAGHVCAEFITTFTSTFFSIGDLSDVKVLAESFKSAFEAVEKHMECLTDSTKMEAIVSFFLYLGTQDILLDGGGFARLIASFAAYFEQHIAMMLLKTSATIKPAKGVELLNSDSHTLVSFFRKRISCSCLDEKYKEVKTISKMGHCCNKHCCHPNQQVERSSMLFCTRCRNANYCSRDCQVADWPVHKVMCEDLAVQRDEFSASKRK